MDMKVSVYQPTTQVAGIFYIFITLLVCIILQSYLQYDNGIKVQLITRNEKIWQNWQHEMYRWKAVLWKPPQKFLAL